MDDACTTQADEDEPAGGHDAHQGGPLAGMDSGKGIFRVYPRLTEQNQGAGRSRGGE